MRDVINVLKFAGGFYIGVLHTIYPLLKSLTVVFEQPTTAHSTILELMFYVRSDFTICAQAFNMASKRSNCSGTELFAVTMRLNGNFTS